MTTSYLSPSHLSDLIQLYVPSRHLSDLIQLYVPSRHLSDLIQLSVPSRHLSDLIQLYVPSRHLRSSAHNRFLRLPSAHLKSSARSTRLLSGAITREQCTLLPLTPLFRSDIEICPQHPSFLLSTF